MKKLFLLLFALCTLPSMAQQPTAYDVKLKNKLHMRVTVCTDGIFRVQVAPRSQFAENLMLRYGVQKADWTPVSCQTQDKGGTYTIATPNHVLAVDKKDGTLRIADKQGRAIIDRVSFVDGKQPLTTQLGKSINEKYADLKVAKNDGIIGDNSNPKTAKDTVETGDYHKCSIINFALRPGERFYGGGSTSRDHIQHRGEILRMWTTYQHTEIPQPFVLSSEGWGVFNNTTLKNFFDIGRFQKDVFSIYNTSDEADFYLMTGSNMPAIINAYTLITGRPYLQPKWAYGMCFGPNMLENMFEILDDAVRFRQMDVPCDLIWLEPQWMEKRYDFSTEKKWNYKLFTVEPYWVANEKQKREHFQLFAGRLKAMGFKLGLWLCENYDLSLPEEDLLARAAGKPESGQEHWMDHLKPFIDNGIRGFKMDPARTIDEHPDRDYYNGYTDKYMHNLNQILLPKQMEVMMRQHTGKRNWHHYTAGYAGTQHWGASTSGDNGGGRTALLDQLNLGMSGFLNTSCDVMSVDSVELEMPSLHFGLFLPWVQINSWYSLRQPFYFSARDQQLYKFYVKLRYSLMPYIYTAAIEGAQTGMPIVRAMPLVFPDDRNVDDACYQYMFGPNLLLGIFSDQIYLPKGEWTDFWTGEKLTGGRKIKHKIPENRAGLLFARQGAIIPMQRDMSFIGEHSIDTLTVKVFPKGKSTYTMLEDDGESYDYEKGAVAATTFDCDQTANRLQFTVQPVKGSYRGMYQSRTYNIEFYASQKPRRVTVNGKPTTAFAFGQDGILRVTLPQKDVHQRATVTVE